ncbi:uncharacterized protein [Littorina saxatilis]|uniref:uncharacterized protein n=1 Tax=Littorina saxatilis TaxID=31220 RepID=UPI0038B4B57C
MAVDEVGMAAKSDPLIRCIGEKKGKSGDKEKFNQIRSKMRELGRLLLKLRALSGQENAQLSDFITPQKFPMIVEATKSVAGFKDCGTIDTPTLAIKLGHSLKLCADILEAKGIESEDETCRSNAKGYLKLHRLRWNDEVSAPAYKSMYRAKKGKVKRLPLSQDVSTFTDFLVAGAKKAAEELEKNRNPEKTKDDWIHLAELTLCQIILFNRRRQGEASKMKIEDYTCEQHPLDPDVLKSLSKLEQNLCGILTRVEIFGKRGRIVPVLLTASMKHSIDILIKFKEEAGVSRSNKYIFAISRCNSDEHIQGSDALRKHVAAAGLVHPEFITSTNLRKHVATMSQVLNLKDNELDMLAQYMGHDVRIHREHYRLPSQILQVTKVSKVLLALEKGNLTRYSNLDDIDVADEENCSSDEEAQDPELEDELALGSDEQANRTTALTLFPHCVKKIFFPTLPSSASGEIQRGW